jgi:Fe-S cluster biogenesis protein NfuA
MQQSKCHGRGSETGKFTRESGLNARGHAENSGVWCWQQAVAAHRPWWGKSLKLQGKICRKSAAPSKFRQNCSHVVTAWRLRSPTVMNPRTQIEAILDRMRPLLQADGGDILLVDVSGRKAFVRLTGKCAGCPSSHLTLHIGVEMAIREALPEFEELVIV